MINESDIDGSATRYITIPNGVKVIEVYASAVSDKIDSNAVSLFVGSTKTWFGSMVHNYAIDFHGYVGVTPNKNYTINLQSGSRLGLECYISISIKYSPEINKQTPSVTDY